MSPTWASRLAALLISVAMSGVMSAVMVARAMGIGWGFPIAWIDAWLIGLAVSFPTASVIVPSVMRLTKRLQR